MDIIRKGPIVLLLAILVLLGALASARILSSAERRNLDSGLKELERELAHEEEPVDRTFHRMILQDRDRLQEVERLAEEFLSADSGESLVSDWEARKTIPDETAFVWFGVSNGTTLVRIYFGPEEPLYIYSVNIRSHRLQKIVESFFVALTTESPNPERRAEQREKTVQYGRDLFQLLFYDADRERGKAFEYIRRAKNLIIAGNGPLAELPFSALVTNQRGTAEYLGAEKAISYVPDLITYYLMRTVRHDPEGETERPALVLGGPWATADTGTSVSSLAEASDAERGTSQGREVEHSCPVCAGEILKGLTGATEEAARIARLYGTEPLTGRFATEAAFRDGARRARVIHLATHYAHCPRDPLGSSLILARDDAQGDHHDSDGRLQIRELRDVELRADLVVLAGCATGRAVAWTGGQGIAMTDAFLHAGARSVVATQWPIEDAISADLMTTLHEHLRHGVGKAEALRLTIRAAAESGRVDPRHWAAFFLVGDPI